MDSDTNSRRTSHRVRRSAVVVQLESGRRATRHNAARVKVHVRASVSQNVACVTDSRANERCELLFSYEDVRVTDDQFAVTELTSLFEHGGHFYFVDPVNNCLKQASEERRIELA